MDELTKVLGSSKESVSRVLPFCVTESLHSKFRRLMEALERRELKRQGLQRLKSALEHEIDEMLKMADQAS